MIASMEKDGGEVSCNTDNFYYSKKAQNDPFEICKSNQIFRFLVFGSLSSLTKIVLISASLSFYPSL